MIEAASLRSRCGIAARTSRTVCMRSTLRLACQFSSVSGIARALTLATTTSSPPNALGGLLHPGGQRVAVADVDGAAGDAAAVRQRLLGRRDLVGVAGAEADDGALVEEGLDDGAADAAGAAGDEDAGAGELQIHGLAFRRAWRR